MKTESLLQYLDSYLGVRDHPDHPQALNGLQVAGPAEVAKVVAAVDASEASIAAASERGADLLLVHHGLFWDGLKPVTGAATGSSVAAGLDALITGEGAHHNHFDAMEEGVHLLLAGHYATETFGVRALARHLGERFGLEWEFVDLPTGL